MTYAVRDSQGRKLRTIVIGFVALTLAVGALCWYSRGYGGDALHLAESPDRSDRLEAIDLLAARSDAAARDALFGLCSDEDLGVAVAAVWALGQNHDRRNGARLARILADKGRHGRVRGQAAEMLGEFKGTDPTVLTNALTKDGDPSVRAGAAKGLGRLRNVKTMGSLFRALSDTHQEVRRRAIEAMHAMMVVRFPYRPDLPADQQPQVMKEIRAYLSQAGVL